MYIATTAYYRVYVVILQFCTVTLLHDQLMHALINRVRMLWIRLAANFNARAIVHVIYERFGDTRMVAFYGVTTSTTSALDDGGRLEYIVLHMQAPFRGSLVNLLAYAS